MSTRKRNNVIRLSDSETLETKFGMLLVIRRLKNDIHSRKIWECLCDCGNIKEVADVNLKRSMVTSCGCNHYKSGKDHLQYTGYEDISGKKWSSVVKGARNRELDFLITKEEVWDLFIKQSRKCKLSGIDICFLKGTASIDRVDSKIGYTISNIQIVHKDINKMKMDFEQVYFIEMCKLITENNERRN